MALAYNLYDSMYEPTIVILQNGIVYSHIVYSALVHTIEKSVLYSIPSKTARREAEQYGLV